MSTSIKVVTVIFTIVLMATSVNASELKGGYLNSATREAMIRVDDNRASIHLYNNPLPMQFGDGEYRGTGKLFVVYYWGWTREVRGRFVDRQGHMVATPSDGYDKVIYLNRYGNITAAAGLDDQEIAAFFPRDQQRNVALVANAQKRPLFAAMRYSSDVLSKMHAASDEVAQTYAMSAGWMGGYDVKNFMQQLLDLSQSREGSSIAAMRSLFNVRANVTTGKTVAFGVSLVAQGGNGTGGSNPIGQGGNGTGGSNPIGQGGNGTGGSNPIGQGGNGTGGSNPIGQGGNGTGGSNPIGQGGNGTGGSNPIGQGGNGTGGSNPIGQGGNGSCGSDSIAQSACDQLNKWSQNSYGYADVEMSGGGNDGLTSLPKAWYLDALTHGTVLMLK
ncbi:MAG: hypothetical protein COV45_08625 [Deltaproteobacteria bacterium CG11_big_fil_rev_8_21_14_0_20_47_16]|nr:MAG: hypothetical protein COV45_08625 [Deltaproteobacteria bacterium CG11_big_fil_rev_8_21_14_0_20_47_16]